MDYLILITRYRCFWLVRCRCCFVCWVIYCSCYI